MRLLTLLTDFGSRDHYVAAVKGTVLALAPDTQIIDISHEVPPGDIAAAAFILAAAAPSFPPGTVHLAVVDPGVGSARGILIAEHPKLQASLVAPDNGLLTPLLDSSTLTAVSRSELFREGPGQTFHGRDRFAPVAAALLRGEPANGLGTPLAEPVRLLGTPPRRETGRLVGRVAYIDRFGNILTDLPADWLPAGAFLATLGMHRTRERASHYAELTPGAPAILAGSLGTLELAARGEDLARRWRAAVGDEVIVSWSESTG